MSDELKEISKEITVLKNKIVKSRDIVNNELQKQFEVNEKLNDLIERTAKVGNDMQHAVDSLINVRSSLNAWKGREQ